MSRMRHTYEAILEGDTVRWKGERPEQSDAVDVTIEIHPSTVFGTDGKLMAKAIREIVADTGGITSINDSAAWQREQRADRALPGREP